MISISTRYTFQGEQITLNKEHSLHKVQLYSGIEGQL